MLLRKLINVNIPNWGFCLVKFHIGCTNSPCKIIVSNKYQHKGSTFSSRPGNVSVLYNNKSLSFKGIKNITRASLINAGHIGLIFLKKEEKWSIAESMPCLVGLRKRK